MRLQPFAIAVAASLTVLSVGCKPPATAPASGIPAAAPTATVPPARQPVSKIVFIDKERACECTQKAIDASWAALQAALQGASLPVERIHMDTQEAFAEGYKAKRAMMAVPGLYFLADDGSVVELLQGEVAAEKVRAVLGR